jgi:hypothetical protein
MSNPISKQTIHSFYKAYLRGFRWFKSQDKIIGIGLQGYTRTSGFNGKIPTRYFIQDHNESL